MNNNIRDIDSLDLPDIVCGVPDSINTEDSFELIGEFSLNSNFDNSVQGLFTYKKGKCVLRINDILYKNKEKAEELKSNLDGFKIYGKLETNRYIRINAFNKIRSFFVNFNAITFYSVDIFDISYRPFEDKNEFSSVLINFDTLDLNLENCSNFKKFLFNYNGIDISLINTNPDEDFEVKKHRAFLKLENVNGEYDRRIDEISKKYCNLLMLLNDFGISVKNIVFDGAFTRLQWSNNLVRNHIAKTITVMKEGGYFPDSNESEQALGEDLINISKKLFQLDQADSKLLDYYVTNIDDINAPDTTLMLYANGIENNISDNISRHLKDKLDFFITQLLGDIQGNIIKDKEEFEKEVNQNRNYIVHGSKRNNFVPADSSKLKDYNSKLKQLIKSYLLHKVGFTYKQILDLNLITEEAKDDYFIKHRINKL